MAPYVSFALGTALIVGVSLLVRRRPAPRFSVENDDIAWL
jgi:hypothetical protein